MGKPSSPMNDLGVLVNPEMLKILDRMFPNQQPSIHELDRQIWVRVGHREIIDTLRRAMETHEPT